MAFMIMKISGSKYHNRRATSQPSNVNRFNVNYRLSRKQKLNHANTYAYFAHCVRAGC